MLKLSVTKQTKCRPLQICVLLLENESVKPFNAPITKFVSCKCLKPTYNLKHMKGSFTYFHPKLDYLIHPLLSHTYSIVHTSSLLPPLEHLSLIPEHQTASIWAIFQ